MNRQSFLYILILPSLCFGFLGAKDIETLSHKHEEAQILLMKINNQTEEFNNDILSYNTQLGSFVFNNYDDLLRTYYVEYDKKFCKEIAEKKTYLKCRENAKSALSVFDNDTYPQWNSYWLSIMNLNDSKNSSTNSCTHFQNVMFNEWLVLKKKLIALSRFGNKFLVDSYIDKFLIKLRDRQNCTKLKLEKIILAYQMKLGRYGVDYYVSKLCKNSQNKRINILCADKTKTKPVNLLKVAFMIRDGEVK